MDVQALHRARDRMLQQRLALTNQIRGLLLDRGIEIAQAYEYRGQRGWSVIGISEVDIEPRPEHLYEFIAVNLGENYMLFSKDQRLAIARGRFALPELLTSDPDAFLELACAGEGICQAGLMLAAPLLREGKLRVVLQGQYDNGDRQFVLCYPHRPLMSRRVRVVVDALSDGLANQPDLHLSPTTLPKQWLASPAKRGKG